MNWSRLGRNRYGTNSQTVIHLVTHCDLNVLHSYLFSFFLNLNPLFQKKPKCSNLLRLTLSMNMNNNNWSHTKVTLGMNICLERVTSPLIGWLCSTIHSNYCVTMVYQDDQWWNSSVLTLFTPTAAVLLAVLKANTELFRNALNKTRNQLVQMRNRLETFLDLT